jgi:predicted TIM-barrel fold metal-dependent hydrolase
MIRRPDGRTFFVASCHAHMGESSLLTRFRGLAPQFHGPQMVEMLDHYGIDSTVAFGMAKPISDYSQDTDAILQGAEDFPGRIVPFARINPHAPNGPELVEKYVARGIKGLKFHPFWDAFQANDKHLVHPILEAAEPHGLTCLFHSGESWLTLPGLVWDLAHDFPGLNFIIGHSGLYGFDAEAVAVAKRKDNLWLDTTELYPVERLRMIVDTVGKDRLLFGIDGPYMNPGIELEKVLRFGRLTDDELDRVLGLNLAELVGLNPADFTEDLMVDYPIAEPEWVKVPNAGSAE